MKKSIKPTLDLAPTKLLPDGYKLVHFLSTVEIWKNDKCVAKVPVPYKPQSFEWWREYLWNAICKAITDPYEQ